MLVSGGAIVSESPLLSSDPGVFLGVDGGGTKTAFALVSSAGELLASALAPSSYYLGQSIDLVEEVLREGVDSVCGSAGVPPEQLAYAFVALPGYGEVSGDVETLNAIPGRVLGHQRYSCDNDMVAGWAGSLGAVDGVNVIGGTGSMAYGENNGRGLRVGGWGELFDDEGSAYWIAIRGLSAFAKMSDGRLSPGPLREHLIAHLQLAAELDLVDVVLNRWQGDRAKIASLARLVSAAAADGDDTCTAILREAGQALAGLVMSTVDQLDYAPGQVVPVSWSGGVFTSDEVRTTFEKQLADAPVELRDPMLPPVVGAALYAARLAGSPLNAETVAKLRTATVAQSASDE
ncbi:BadF/BadG/BcrA/BcrD ATPase family protein [Streptomyces sp. SID13031]|uniref:N-acetylglucosamine kinase n=1 Tax=Streptomyces sp. SID13031 TaxID=2706046 RepID=UPI0013C55333|nr:BadF/BadG/BcrA/BcrD ATPase family protein [Streptomyces sp. SID13031]NEA30641.1 N-acetylglucosamine kinase [Streptomyces sp. SID13031]